jgi:hypothetical protein
METIIIGFPVISKLVRGQTVQLSNVALIPDDQLFNESKNMDCCVKFPLPTAEESGVSALQTTNSTKAKIVTSPHCIMNYCAMGEAECVADEQHCPYDQRRKT